MHKVTNFIRSNAGKQSIPKFYRKHMSEKCRTLESIYNISNLNFDCSFKKEKKKLPRYVVWADSVELINTILQERSENGNVLLKVMADGGQGFFKICVTIIPENYYDDEFNESVEFVQPQRSTYTVGGTISKHSKVTGVNKLIMICCVPDVDESYENIRLLFELTQINKITFKFSADFKVILIVNGKQTATSKYPSPYCFITLNELREKYEEECPEERCLRLMTYGDLRDNNNKFKIYGNDKKYAKECRSCINPPLFDEDNKVCVFEKCVPPELHLLQGFVNHLFWDGLVPLLGRENALLWPKKLKLIAKNYQGDVFEGNACRKLIVS